MKKLIPTKLFYNFKGFDKKNREISYGNGILDLEEIGNINTLDLLIDKAKLANSNVAKINLIALTPLEFDIIE